MDILELTFKFSMLCGCGRLNFWTSACKRLAYHVYTIAILILIHTFMLSQLMDLILIVDNSDDFSDNFYVLLAMINSCCKMFILLANRGNIEIIIDTLTRTPFLAVGSDEEEIRQKSKNQIWLKTLWYFILVQSTCMCVSVTSLLTEFRKCRLTFRGWLPFDYSSQLLFTLVYAHQLISFTVASVHHVACDSLIWGLLIYIRCQIEILECRLKKSTSNPDVLRECVLQHNHIFEFARFVNDKFKLIIFIQFVLSTLTVCFNLYRVAQSTGLRAKYIPLLLYTFTMLMQIFVFCWYGNEVKLKSRRLMDTIFEMKWFEMDIHSKKALLMIMRRGAVPIEFTSTCIISMNLDSFLLKTSYSAYNLLQQT